MGVGKYHSTVYTHTHKNKINLKEINSMLASNLQKTEIINMGLHVETW